MQVNMKDTKKPAHGFVRFRLNSAPNNLKTDIRPGRMSVFKSLGANFGHFRAQVFNCCTLHKLLN